MSISKTRSLLYRLARMLGWMQIFTDTVEGHPDRAMKKLTNKLVGRKVISKVWWK